MTARGDRLSALKVGQTETISRTIAVEDVAAFARLSNDYNELHLSDEFAARTELSERVAHGFLSASLLSALVGTKIPGRGSLYVSQSIDFTAPVYINDFVEARATIEKIDVDTRLVTLATEIVNQHGKPVLRGMAQVKVLRLAEDGDERARPIDLGRSGGLLAGRVALITGASRGAGRAMARLFAAEGARVWINFHKSPEAAEKLANDISAAGGVSRTIKADVTNEADVARLLQTVTSDGGLHILVNNAGPRIRSGAFTSFAWSDVAEAYEKVVGSAFRVTQAALPALKRSRGTVIMIVSTAALGRTAHNWLPYVTAKSALQAMAKNLAQELGPQGVTVNMISPSLVETDLVSEVPDRVRQMMVSRTPLRRLATTEDVAGAALMLASPYARFITGENLLVTGGEVMI